MSRPIWLGSIYRVSIELQNIRSQFEEGDVIVATGTELNRMRGQRSKPQRDRECGLSSFFVLHTNQGNL
jgi:hypothetical protein